MSTTDEQPRRRGRPPSGGREAILEATLELLRERGIANLTSRDVAARAGISDASVYYHFRDRTGLLQAVFEYGMKPLQFMSELDSETMDRRQVLDASLRSLEAFFDDILPVLVAAQADPELGAALAAHVEEHDLGPHKGVAALGEYLRAEQAAGRAAVDVDVDAVALILIECAFGRSARRQMLVQREDDRLPTPQRLLETVNRMLDPGSGAGA